MVGAQGHKLPMGPNVHLGMFGDGGEVDQQFYLSIIGSLMYAALGTRPDISFSVSSLSRFNIDPRARNLTAAKRVLRYFKETCKFKLIFDGNGDNSGLTTDSDWANDLKNRKSVGGYVFMYGGNPISWQSKKKQDLVATFTMEAEYTAFLDACKEALWPQKLIQDISSPPKPPTVWLEELIAEINYEKGNTEKISMSNSLLPTILYPENQAAIKTAKMEGLKARAKHFDIRSRDLWKKRFVEFEYINTTESLVDIFPKALPRDRQHLTGGLKQHQKLD
jgi:hypothetical protein